MRWHRTDSAKKQDEARPTADPAAEWPTPPIATPNRVSVFSGAVPLASGTYGVESGVGEDSDTDAVAPEATQLIDYTNSLAANRAESITADPTEPGSDITPQPGFGPAGPITPEADYDGPVVGRTTPARHGFNNTVEGGSLVASQPSGTSGASVGTSSIADDPLSAPLTDTVNETAPVPQVSDADLMAADIDVPAPDANVEPPRLADVSAASLPLPPHIDLESVEVPHIDLDTHFGERIEAMIAQATIEAENTRQDAKAQAKQIHDDAYADADRLIAAAKRQAAEIVAAAQERAHEHLSAAEATRAQAQIELEDAHQEAEEVRARAHEHADRVRAEGDAHVREIIARAHADTADQLHEARQELVDLSERKVELENQMAAIRTILEETSLHTTEIPLVPFDGSFTPLAGGVVSEPFAGWADLDLPPTPEI